MHFLKCTFMVLFLFIFSNCSDENITNSDSNDVNVQVDFQSGFTDHLVSIKFNETIYLNLGFLNMSPLLGQKHSF